MSTKYMQLILILTALLLMLAGCSATPSVPETTHPAETLTPMVTEAAPTEPEGPKVQLIHGIEMYSMDGALYPAELGAPVLGKDKVSELYAAGDIQEAAEQITHIGDAIYYLLKAGRFDQPQEATTLFSTLISGDYNSVGLIEFQYSDNYYCMVYVGHNETFYGFDPFSLRENWIYQTQTSFSNPDANLLAENLQEVFPFKGRELVCINVSGDMSKPHGAKVFSYIDTTFPEGLGRPVLSDAEIDALIAAQDYAKTAETITTLADAVNYYRRAGFVFHNNADMNSDGRFNYVQSAWQVLKDKQGQCVTMSNVNHYLLYDDYDEIGYVEASSPNDGHVMTYILEDGNYYLINSVDYTYEQYFGWLDSYPDVLGCADDFQEIADSIVKNMRLGDGKLVNRVHLINSPGDHVFGRQGNKELYPKECQVVQYYGYGVTYGKTTLDWISQTRIDY